MNLSDILRQIDDCVQRGDFVLALELIRKTRGQVAASDIVSRNDLNQREAEVAQRLLDEVRPAFNDLLLSEETLPTARTLLTSWKVALGDSAEQDGDYRTARSRIEALEREQTERKFYLDALRQVENLWRQAEEGSQAQLSNALLMADYTKARDLARDALARYPDNAMLQELLSRAEERRELLSGEREAVTSGVQFKFYYEAITYILRVPPGHHVLVLDRAGNEQGRFPREEALKRMVDNARVDVNSFVYKYIEEARQRLNENKPREAEAALAQWDNYQKLDDLLQSNSINDLFNPQNINQRDTLRGGINTALEQLKNAEELARQAAKLTGALEAAKQYQQALSAYAGAQDSQVVKEVRQNIQAALESELDRHLPRLEALSNVESLSLYYTSPVLTEVQTSAETIYTDYSQAQGFSLMDRLVRVREYADHAWKLRETIDSIHDELKQAEALQDARPAEAYDLLQTMLTQYDNPLLQASPRYSKLEATLELRLNERRAIERFKRFLDDNDVTQVEAALKQAKEAAETSREYRQEFEKVRLNLEVYAEILKVDATIRSDGYEAIIRKLERFENERNLDPAIKTQLNNHLADVRGKMKLVRADENRMKDARAARLGGDFASAYEMLSEVKHFANRTAQTDYETLFEDVRENYVGKLVQNLSRVNLQASRNVAEVDQDLSRLKLLNPVSARQYESRVTVYKKVNEVRQKEKNASRPEELQPLIDDLNSNIELATGDDYEEMGQIIARLERKQVRLEVRQLEDSLKRLMERIYQIQEEKLPPALEKEQDDTITRLMTLNTRLAGLTTIEDAVSRTEFRFWRITLLLVQAENLTGTRHREAFRTAAEEAITLAEDLALVEQKKQRSQLDSSVTGSMSNLMERAKRGGTFIEAIEAVDNVVRLERLEGNYSLFQDALQQWNDTVELYVAQFPGLQRWYRRRTNQVRERLVQLLEARRDASQPFSDKTIPFYARLLLLDAKDSIGVRLLDHLNELPASITTRTDNLYSRVTGSRGYEAADGEVLLKEHRQALAAHHDYLDVLTSLVHSFKEMPTIRERSRLVDEGLSKWRARTQDAQVLLDEFVRLVEGFLTTANGFQPRSFNAQVELQVLDDLWTALETSIGDKTSPGLLQHPFLHRAHQHKDDIRQYYADFLKWVEAAVQAFEREDYEHFLELAAWEDGVETLKTAQLQDRVAAREKRQPDRELRGWNALTETAQRRQQEIAVVFQWAMTFGVRETASVPETAPAGSKADKWFTPPTIGLPAASPAVLPGDTPVQAETGRVVNWQKERDGIQTLWNKGEFDEAAERLMRVVGGSLEDLDDRYSLTEAVDISRQVPLPDGRGQALLDYPIALREVETQRAEALISQMRQVHTTLTQAKATGETWLREMDGKQQRWQTLYHQAAEHLAAGEQAMEKSPRVLYRRTICTALAKLRAALDGMKDIAPQHPRYVNLSHDPRLKLMSEICEA